jgi:hypothetical protein
MEEELEYRGGRQPVSLREADGVDAHERVVARGTDEVLEHIEQVAVAGTRSGELLELLRQEPLIHSRHGGSSARLCELLGWAWRVTRTRDCHTVWALS